MDVLADAQDMLRGARRAFRGSASEATAAAMLAASVHYPMRGAVTLKSTGRHQCRVRRARQPRLGRRHRRRADHRRRGLRRRLLDHAGAQPRLRDEVADVAARSAARTCRRSSRTVEDGFELSEVSNTPVMLEVRIRACHVHGTLHRQGQQAARRSRPDGGAGKSAPRHSAASSCRRPTFVHEKEKLEKRWPAAVELHQASTSSTSFSAARPSDVGIVMQGGMYNGVHARAAAARPRRRLGRQPACRSMC